MFPVRTQRDEAMNANVGQTIRQPSTALLTIDSEDRFDSYQAKREATYGSYNYSPYDFTITKRESIMNGFFTRLGVSEVVFPWNIPNINAQTNRMRVGYAAAPGGPFTTFTLSVAAGFYTPSQLATAIQAELNAVPALAGTVVTYGQNIVEGLENVPQFSFDFTASGQFVTFTPLAYQPNPALPAFYQFNNTKQLFDVLGLNSLAYLPAVQKSGIDTLCQSTRYIDIVCSILTYNQSLKDTTSQVVARDSLCRVYLGALNSNMIVPTTDSTFAPPGTTPGVVYAQYSTPKQIQWVPNQPVPSGLRFQIFDDEGTPLEDLFGGTSSPEINWSMTILVSEN
jgi:hypothetical protein